MRDKLYHMKTYTTTEAIEKLGGISRPTFSRWVKRYNIKAVKVGVGRGHQSVWEAKRIDTIALYLKMMDKETEVK